MHHSSLRNESDGWGLELSVHSGLHRMIITKSDITGDVSEMMIVK